MTNIITEEVEGTPKKELHLGWALVLISIAQLMIVLDATISNIALPYIQADLGFSDPGLTWVVTIYALTFGGLLLLGGRLGDLYGRRRMFALGLIIFAIASLIGGLAESQFAILAGRALQGVGGALASPAALALITTTFPAGPQRNRAMAVYAAMSGAGAAVGLILGGWLTGLSPEIFGVVIDGWRLTFLINVPIGIIAAVLANRLLTESKSTPGGLDVPGAIAGTSGLLALVYGLSLAGNRDYGWDSSRTISFLVIGVGVAHRVRDHRDSGEEPAAALPDLHEPDPGSQFRGDVPAAGSHVRDVLLPQPLHPAGHGLHPAQGWLRVPALLGGHRHCGGSGFQPDQPGGSALPGGLRDPVGGCGALRLLSTAV